MSAPNTNIDKQARRHRGPLIGMALAVIFGVAVILYWLFEESAQSDPPAPQDQIEQQSGTTPDTQAPVTAAPVTPAPGEGAVIAPQTGTETTPAAPPSTTP
ncbi:hypothetical protein GCM10010873_10210 [Cypionkella aquatica]|uniref:Uncharacterized protein n=1 Tax=Cypionkella aquatica TaxID=1756042 RepID=A0AA37TR52_9RHOB|nr:hypothetical protein [Cypionkella aquatica]GLS86047.1 hypothetical protein GCM10010873_10210 [Cypionkella aquatica]